MRPDGKALKSSARIKFRAIDHITWLPRSEEHSISGWPITMRPNVLRRGLLLPWLAGINILHALFAPRTKKYQQKNLFIACLNREQSSRRRLALSCSWKKKCSHCLLHQVAVFHPSSCTDRHLCLLALAPFDFIDNVETTQQHNVWQAHKVCLCRFCNSNPFVYSLLFQGCYCK